MPRQLLLLHTSSSQKHTLSVKSSSRAVVLSILQDRLFKCILIFQATFFFKSHFRMKSSLYLPLYYSAIPSNDVIRLLSRFSRKPPCHRTKRDIIMPSTLLAIKIQICIYEMMNLFSTGSKCSSRCSCLGSYNLVLYKTQLVHSCTPELPHSMIKTFLHPKPIKTSPAIFTGTTVLRH